MTGALAGSITVAPVVPWPLIAALGAIAVMLVAISIWRRARGWPLRLAVAIVLVAALLNPAVVREQRSPEPDIAVVVVDESKSQSVAGRTEATQAAIGALRERLGAYPDLETRFVWAGSPSPEDGDEARGTRLLGALDRALVDVPLARLAGVIMITDGQVADIPVLSGSDASEQPGDQLLSAVDRLDVDALPDAPVHVLLTGRPGERDRRIIVDQAPAFGLVGQPLAMSIRVEEVGSGQSDGTAPHATVRLRVDGDRETLLSLPPGRSVPVPLTLNHAGPTVVELDVEATPDEVSALNNRSVVVVNGVRDRLRVLLVSGQPHPGERTWRNLLKSDPAVDLVHFTILRPPDKDDAAAINELSLIAFPVDELFEEKLYEFDLIVFDRYVLRGVLPWRYLARTSDFVRAGGALLLAVGPEFATPLSLFRTPLGEVMPTAPTGNIIEEAFRPSITVLGHRHPVTSALPGESIVGAGSGDAASEPVWGRWFRLVEAEERSGDTLMTGPGGRPLLVVDRVGSGRIAQLLSDHLWLWARGYDGGGPHGELLRRLVHWLMREPELEEERLTASVDGDDLVIQRRSLSPEPIEIIVTAPDGTTRELVLEPSPNGLAEAVTAADQSGLWLIGDGDQTTFAASGPLNSIELADLRATADYLGPVAAATDGSVSWLADGLPSMRRVLPGRDTAGEGWMGLRRNGASVVTGVQRVPLMSALVFLALALGALGAAWWREGR